MHNKLMIKGHEGKGEWLGGRMNRGRGKEVTNRKGCRSGRRGHGFSNKPDIGRGWKFPVGRGNTMRTRQVVAGWSRWRWRNFATTTPSSMQKGTTSVTMQHSIIPMATDEETPPWAARAYPMGPSSSSTNKTASQTTWFRISQRNWTYPKKN